MCGIAGWWARTADDRPDDAALRAVADSIRHRGPDDEGYFVSPSNRVALAHRRLSIIDLSAAGHQPMVAADGDSVLVYNGELYNFVQLRRELEALGHRFHSRTDSEVVLNALLQWDLAALDRFRGMFAFALWQESRGRLLLARDPLGMKPLYVHADAASGGAWFASELKAFLTVPGFRARVDESVLSQFVEFGYIFDRDRTAFEGVTKIPPGHFLEIRNGIASAPRAYYEAPLVEREPAGDLVETLAECLETVVAEHMVADVPVGLLLSGGLDSSLVAALASRHAKVTTISMGFARSGIDERPFARKVAQHVGSEHLEIEITPEEIRDGIEEGIWHFDDLFADWGTISTRLMYKKCRELGIKVVLVGEGSDELFGGYPVFRAAVEERGPQWWKLFKLYRRYAGRRYGRLYAEYARIMRRHLARTGGDFFSAVRLFESQQQLPNNYVMKVDKASMSVGVEARAPFLDRRVADIAYTIPGNRLLAGGTTKSVLREVARSTRLLPDGIVGRPKFGGSMAHSWMDESEDFRDYARSVVLDRSGWVDRLGLRRAMEAYFNDGRRGYSFPHPVGIFANVAWRVFQLNIWSTCYLPKVREHYDVAAW